MPNGPIFDNGQFYAANKVMTPAGQTGAKTINAPAGSVRLAAAQSSLVVTNNLVTVNSIVMLQIASNDATCVSVQVVPANGSFTIVSASAATAETRIDFVIVN